MSRRAHSSHKRAEVKVHAPTPQEVHALVALYNAGQSAQIQPLAEAMVAKFPAHPFGWKILGAVLGQSGRAIEALSALQKLVSLSPGDAEAHGNLGVVLHNLGRLQEAKASLQRALKIQPDSADAHNGLGIVLRDLGSLDQAETSFRRALRIRSDFADAHNNLGVTLRELGRLQEAKECFQSATRTQPHFVEAHSNLGNILRDLGCRDEAEQSYRRAVALRPQSPWARYRLGTLIMDLARSEEAAEQFRVALQLRPDFVEAHNDLGIVLLNLGRRQEAKQSFESAIRARPDFAQAHNNLGNVQRDLGALEQAEACFRRALSIHPEYPEAYNGLAVTLRDLGRPEQVEANLRRALQLRPDFAEAHNNLGNTLWDLTRLDEAESSFRRALQIRADYAEPYSNLGAVLMELGRLNEAQDSLSRALELAPMNARTLATALSFIPYKQSDHRFAQLEAVHAGREKLPVIERVRFEFAMGKAMEGIGQYDRAFDAYDEANRLYRDIHPYDEAADVRSLQRTRDLFTPELLALDAAPAPAGAGEPRQRVPIFIVGMLRSGTTLVEQMLASHPAIFGAGELTILGEIAKKADLLLHERTSGESLRQALRKLGDEYLDQLWRHAPAAGYITDKLPGNYRHLGLIHLMLPDAKIIHCLREPMDSCFSCFSLHFKVGHYYSYDQATLGRQYLRYQQLMQHWRQALPPGRVLDVCYEHVVADAEREARRLLDHLDLAWDPACLRFYETARAVRTASVAQVRKPIYASSVARWKHFEENLGVLLELVGPTAASPASIRTSVS